MITPDANTIHEINNNSVNEKDLDREKHLRNLTKTFTGIDKPLKNAKVVANLKELIFELYNVFNSDYVNIEYVNHLLLSYKSNPADWKKFAKFDRYKYTRNLVDEGNGKFNLIILCWGEGHGSAIHDHANSHCFMKMLKGELCEIRYEWPANKICSSADSDDEEFEGNELQEISRTTLEEEGVCYINDTLGLHRVENASHTNVAVSLHLYCPPFDKCSVFNKATGHSTSCPVTFWTKFGERRNKEILDKTIAEDN